MSDEVFIKIGTLVIWAYIASIALLICQRLHFAVKEAYRQAARRPRSRWYPGAGCEHGKHLFGPWDYSTHNVNGDPIETDRYCVYCGEFESDPVMF